MKRTIKTYSFILFFAAGFMNLAAQENIKCNLTVNEMDSIMAEMEKLPDSEWKNKLTQEQYRILREKGTEAPFSGKYYDHHEEGVYKCAACGNELFESETKYESGSGWPSFYKPVSNEVVDEKEDNSFMMRRTEVVCGKCKSHLGHVFPDGPKPTGQRYCINSAALDFEKKEK